MREFSHPTHGKAHIVIYPTANITTQILHKVYNISQRIHHFPWIFLLLQWLTDATLSLPCIHAPARAADQCNGYLVILSVARTCFPVTRFFSPSLPRRTLIYFMFFCHVFRVTVARNFCTSEMICPSAVCRVWKMYKRKSDQVTHIHLSEHKFRFFVIVPVSYEHSHCCCDFLHNFCNSLLLPLFSSFRLASTSSFSFTHSFYY